MSEFLSFIYRAFLTRKQILMLMNLVFVWFCLFVFLFTFQPLHPSPLPCRPSHSSPSHFSSTCLWEGAPLPPNQLPWGFVVQLEVWDGDSSGCSFIVEKSFRYPGVVVVVVVVVPNEFGNYSFELYEELSWNVFTFSCQDGHSWMLTQHTQQFLALFF